ncbi:MAG: AbrB/MazE/SpoVT family DNA-binding domain-containing protein [Actinobacteria bacterium]|nr:AbrB/MazE/SpoVT family DNA-binding domain-containing protein [Actinomycetota bacterium]
MKKIDNLGRIVVPKGYRTMLGLRPGDALKVEVTEGRLIMYPHQDSCTFCGSEAIAHSFKGKCICRECVETIRYGYRA